MMQRNLDESKTEMELFFFSLIFVFGLFGATTSSAYDEKKKPRHIRRIVVKWELTSDKQVQYVNIFRAPIASIYVPGTLRRPGQC